MIIEQLRGKCTRESVSHWQSLPDSAKLNVPTNGLEFRNMPIDIPACKALDVNELPVLPNLKIVSISVDAHTDWTGDESLRVSVLLDEDVDIEKVTGKETGDLKRAIRQQLQSHGITLFPYIYLAKQSELDELDDEG